MNLAGKSAIVTGGSRGLGRDVAELIHEAGGDVTVCAKSSEMVGRAESTERWYSRWSAFDLAVPPVVAALSPAVDMLGSLIGQVSSLVLAPVSLTEWSEHQQVLQSREAWESVRDWIDQVNPRFSFEVSDRYLTARSITDAQVAAAQAGRDSITARVDEAFDDGLTVVCLPSTVTPAPPIGQKVSERHSLRLRNSALTSIAGNTGRPQFSLPVAEVDGLPVGLSLLGNRGSDEMLIELARELAAAL